MNRLEKIWEYLQTNAGNFGMGIVTMLVAVLAARLVYGVLRHQVVKRSQQKLLWILLADVAWASVIPMRSEGTVIFFGPSLMVIVTSLLAATDRPPAGFWETTWPAVSAP